VCGWMRIRQSRGILPSASLLATGHTEIWQIKKHKLGSAERAIARRCRHGDHELPYVDIDIMSILTYHPTRNGESPGSEPVSDIWRPKGESRHQSASRSWHPGRACKPAVCSMFLPHFLPHLIHLLPP